MLLIEIINLFLKHEHAFDVSVRNQLEPLLFFQLLLEGLAVLLLLLHSLCPALFSAHLPEQLASLAVVLPQLAQH